MTEEWHPCERCGARYRSARAAYLCCLHLISDDDDGGSGSVVAVADGGRCSDGAERCDLCDEDAVDCLPVTNDKTGETRDANLCKEHRDKVVAYTRGEEVDWDV